jgi:hypothetical protein
VNSLYEFPVLVELTSIFTGSICKFAPQLIFVAQCFCITCWSFDSVYSWHDAGVTECTFGMACPVAVSETKRLPDRIQAVLLR